MGLTVFPNRHEWFMSWVGALAGLGLLAVIGYADGAIAQSIPIPVPAPMQSPEATQQFIFVNSLMGKDTNAGNTQRSPFRTITHALQSAQPNTVIMLAIGTYTPDTGETFPLIMPPGVQIQGDPGTKGESILIQGGGSFTTATAGRQNVAIGFAVAERVVGAGQIVGVTISNPNLNGYGLWIESGSPVIANNTFTDNNLAGIAVMGDSKPTLRGNAFSRNRSGVIVAETAQPSMRDSLDQAGSAITALPPTTSRRQSSRTVAQAPDRSTTRHANVFVAESAAPRTVSISSSYPQGVAPAEAPSRLELAPPARSADTTPRNSRSIAVNIPVPAPRQVAELRRDLPVSRSTPIPVPPPVARAQPQAFAAPNANLLPVPSEPPIGNVGNLPTVSVSRNPLQQREVGTRQTAAARGLRYRVIVSAGRRADRVRSLFPNAFTTYSGGQAVLQVGAFGDRANAEEAAQILDSNGLNGMIETLDN
jgi:parallel beta-helix repeat protein